MKNIFLYPSLITRISSFRQKQFSISRNELDDKKEKIPIVQACLLYQQGKLIDFSIEDGNFPLKEVSRNYQLEIEIFTYELFEKPFILNENRQREIHLAYVSTYMEETEIVAKLKTVSYKNGNININVENSVFEKLFKLKTYLPGFRKSE